jgi:hypothetical protein
MEDVPGATTFTVEDMVAVRSLSHEKISIEINFEVRFIKSTMFRFMIESSTDLEMQKYFTNFYAHVKRICEEYRRNHPLHIHSHNHGHGRRRSRSITGGRSAATTPRGSPASSSSPRNATNKASNLHTQSPEAVVAPTRQTKEKDSNIASVQYTKAVKSKSQYWTRIFSDVWEECKEVGLKIFQITCVCLLLYGIVYIVQTQQAHVDHIRRLQDSVNTLLEQQKILQDELNTLKQTSSSSSGSSSS